MWDFWVTTHESRYHIFYLQAPRSIGDPDLRHANASVGHAVSDDLVTWQVLADALRPGKPGSWDEMATWTGSIIAAGDIWHMFYTGAALREGVVTQRIGSAVSRDLTTWTKTPGPLFCSDRQWYETRHAHNWFEEAWRDPWVFQGTDGLYHALVTARANQGPPDGRGVIGHASSPDLEHWEVGPPISDSGEFGHLEVSQLVCVADRYLLVFSCQGSRVSHERITRLGSAPADATYTLEADSPLGPFPLEQARPALPADYYSGRLIQTQGGDWVWLAFRDVDNEGRFVGELSDPIPYG